MTNDRSTRKASRRKVLTATASIGAIALAGCSSGNGSPPPRRSHVYNDLSVQNGSIMVSLYPNITVESRANIGQQNSMGTQFDLGDLSPVGVASAKGRGATGRGSSGGARSAGSTRGGRGKYGGGSRTGGGIYAVWWSDHEDEVEEYSAQPTEMGFARVADLNAEDSQLPPPGPVDWDQRVQLNNREQTFNPGQPGWYRVGTHLTSRNGNHDFGWEAIDFQVRNGGQSMEIANQWKVSPRL